MPRLASGALALAILASSCALDPDAGFGASEEGLGDVRQAMQVCADRPTVHGIDVSRYQGKIDWQMLSGAGVSYTWIQVSRDFDSLHPKFEDNWQSAKDVGILRATCYAEENIPLLWESGGVADDSSAEQGRRAHTVFRRRHSL